MRRFTKHFILIGIVILLAGISAGAILISQSRHAEAVRSLVSGPYSRAGHRLHQPAAITNGLIGWWTLDSLNGSGKFEDRTGNGYDGTLSGFSNDTTDYIVPGKFSNGLQFDGNDDYVDTGADAPFHFGNTTFSVSFWFKAPSTITNGSFAVARSMNSGGWTVDLTTNCKIRYQFKTSSNNQDGTNIPGSLNLCDNMWHLATAVITTSTTVNTDNNALIYLDGVQQSTSAFARVDGSGNPYLFGDSVAGNLMFGRRATSTVGTYFGSATLDDIRIYNRSLTQSEITQLAQGSSPGACDQACVGWWKFDEGSGTSATDSSGNANTGTLTNMGATNTSGWWGSVFGTGLAFDGTNDYVSAGSGTSLSTITTGELSLSAWVMNTASTMTGYRMILSNTRDSSSPYYGYSLLLDTNKNIRFFLFNNSLTQHTSTAQLQDNRWYYITATYDGTTMKLYIDGVLDSSKSASGAFSSTTASYPLMIGRMGFSASFFWQGFLDDIRVYNRTLTAAQIYELYSASR